MIDKEKNSKYLKSYNQNGYIVIKELLSKEEVTRIKKSLNRFVGKFSAENSREINFTDENTINSIHHMDDWIWTKKLKNNRKLRSLARLLIGHNIRDFGAELFAKPAKKGLKSPPHQDNFYWCLNDANGLTVWIALDSSSRSNGGVYYYRGSHKKGLLKHKNSYAPGSSQEIKNKKILKDLKIITPNLEAGDCLIHHSLVVHGSSDNKSIKSRIGWTIRYISEKSKIDYKMKRHYETELKNQINQRKKNINARF